MNSFVEMKICANIYIGSGFMGNNKITLEQIEHEINQLEKDVEQYNKQYNEDPYKFDMRLEQIQKEINGIKLTSKNDKQLFHFAERVYFLYNKLEEIIDLRGAEEFNRIWNKLASRIRKDK